MIETKLSRSLKCSSKYDNIFNFSSEIKMEEFQFSIILVSI